MNAKKIFVLVLSILLFCATWSQVYVDSSSKKLDKWAIEFSFAPNYSYRNLQFTQSESQNPSRYQDFQTFKKEEMPSFNAGFSILGKLELSNVISILSGLSYTRYSYRSIKFDSIEYISSSTNTKAYLTNSSYFFKESFANIPVLIRFRLTGEKETKFNLISTIGMSLGLLNEGKYIGASQLNASIQVPNGATINNVFAFATNANLGVSYKPSRNCYILLEPGATYFLTSYPFEYPMKKNIYSFNATLTIGFILIKGNGSDLNKAKSIF